MLQTDIFHKIEARKATRRAALTAGCLGAIGLSLTDFLRLKAAAAPATATKAKSIILLWLWGGPSHLDTFDMKPKAPIEYRGPYVPVATNVPGMEICELLPQLARRADRYSLIRCMQSTSNDHGIAGTIGLTGSDAGATSLGGQSLPGQVKPTHGSVVSRVIGSEPSLPSFVTIGSSLHQGKRRISGEGGGLFGSLHETFRLEYSQDKDVKLPQLQLLAGQTQASLSARRALQQELSLLSRPFQQSPQVERMDKFSQQAFSLLTSQKVHDVYDLDREKPELRSRYGMYRFGQGCLMARRLVDAGVRFVQVNWSSHVEPVEDSGDGGWDTHDRHFQQFQDRHSWMFDQSLSALLDDLEERGLLNETIVVAVGEFGRTPKINDKAGRDHWQQCYSALIAGGGLRTGRVVGASDAKGEYPTCRPLSPADLFRTLLHQMGIGTTQLTNVGAPLLGEVVEELT